MDEAIGNLDCDNQGVFMEVVQPTHINFGKDTVVWLRHMAHRGLAAS